MNSFEQEFERCQKLVNDYLSVPGRFGASGGKLQQAMEYSLNAGGKRVRPILTMKFAEAVGSSKAELSALPFGCAIEMLHTYSLIHDDLPCMDNDSLRRGKPTNHVVFGEASAVLAGDALQAAAFEEILLADVEYDIKAKVAYELAHAAGSSGMCQGQVLDMEGETRQLSLDELTFMHRKKTGALLECACVSGVIAAGGWRPDQEEAARAFAAEIGLAYQIRDDILDCTSTTEQLGKPVGSDASNHKSTFVTLLGIEKCEEMIAECTQRAKVAVQAAFKDSSFLCDMADWLAGRTK